MGSFLHELFVAICVAAVVLINMFMPCSRWWWIVVSGTLAFLVVLLLFLENQDSLRLPVKSEWQQATGSIYDAANRTRFLPVSWSPFDLFPDGNSHAAEYWFATGPSKRHGLGCFALRDIPAGTWLARDTHPSMVLLNDGSILSDPPRGLWDTVGTGTGMGKKSKFYHDFAAVYESPGQIYDHNNVQYVSVLGFRWLRATRPIAKGEELLLWYGTSYWLAHWLIQIRAEILAQWDQNGCIDRQWIPAQLLVVHYARHWIRLPGRDDGYPALHDMLAVMNELDDVARDSPHALQCPPPSGYRVTRTARLLVDSDGVPVQRSM